MPETPTEEKSRRVDTVLRPKRHSRRYDRMIDIIKTLPWVVPITIIIWIYAERMQTVKDKKETFPIAVRIDSPHRIAALSNPADGLVVATLDGPIANLQNVVALLNAKPDHPAIVYTVPADTASGTVRTLTLSAIADNPIFMRNGITVKDVAPAQLEIMVDDIQEPIVPVKAREGMTTLEGTPQFTPAEVKIRAPSSLFIPDKAHGNLFVTANLDTKPGLHEHERVGVVWSNAGKNISIEPSEVDATYTVRSQDKVVIKRGIPIWVLEPPSTRTKYQITAPDTLPQITFAGPEAQLNQLNEGLVAILYLRANDLHEGDQTEQLHFELPPDVRIASKPVDYTVTFHVTELKP